MRTRVALLIAFVWTARAEIIDRVAVRVGSRVVTESEIKQDIRLTAFLQGEPVVIDAKTKRESAERLVDQLLIRTEMEVNQYPAPDASSVDEQEDQIIEQRFGNDKKRYESELARYELNRDAIRKRLLWQLTLIRFIDVRFQTGIQVQDKDIKEYFEKEIRPKVEAAGVKDPDMEEYREQVEQSLIHDQANTQAEEWLKQTRARMTIEFRPGAFQ
jgi:peptidyl-prolyl cis-trans isomerase SurA